MKFNSLVLLITITLVSHLANAQGDLLITPKRVVFEGSKQRETLSLVNIGKDTAVYTITFVQKIMKEDGSFVNIEKADSGSMYADPYLRVFPRKITLAPGEAQAVMLQYKKDASMKAGEYRSHLYFRAEKNNTPLGLKKQEKDSKALSVQLTPVYGLSIPVIIRSGLVSLSTTITDVNLISSGSSKPAVKLTINRSGNISSYGDIRAEFINANGKTFLAGILKSVGVYTSISKRNLIMELKNFPDQPTKNGRLRVLYTSPEGTKYEVYASTEIKLN